MNCPNCGTAVQREAIFCQTCGQRLEDPEAAANATSDPAGAPAAEPKVSPPAPPAGPAPAVERDSLRSLQAAADDDPVQDAEILWHGRYSIRAMANAAAAAAAVTVAGLVALIALWPGSTVWLAGLAAIALVWLYVAGVYLVRRLGLAYRLTPYTLFCDRGVLTRTTSPIEIIHVDDIVLQQSLLERWLGVGTIRIISNDPTDPKLEIQGVAGIQEAFAKIDHVRRKERRKRALRVENL